MIDTSLYLTADTIIIKENSSYWERLLIALIIFVLNSILLPLAKYFLNKWKQKTKDKDILKIINDLDKQVSKLTDEEIEEFAKNVVLKEEHKKQEKE